MVLWVYGGLNGSLGLWRFKWRKYEKSGVSGSDLLQAERRGHKARCEK